MTRGFRRSTNLVEKKFLTVNLDLLNRRGLLRRPQSCEIAHSEADPGGKMIRVQAGTRTKRRVSSRRIERPGPHRLNPTDNYYSTKTDPFRRHRTKSEWAWHPRPKNFTRRYLGRPTSDRRALYRVRTPETFRVAWL